MSLNKKFEELEKKLNIATDLIDELEIDDYEITPIDMSQSKELMAITDDTTEVFSIETLKADFIIIRQNVMKLINTGQRILETASMIDVSDMKAAQLSALSSLQQTLGNNLQLMVGIYKEICEIEKMRLSVTGKVPEGSVSQINSGNVVNNNTIVFSGDTNALLDIINQNQKEIS